jgi:hypothetical protein
MAMWASGATARAEEPVDLLVVDLSRAANLASDVAKISGVRVIGGGGLEYQGAAELREARHARSSKSCTLAIALARKAVLELAEVRASTSVDVTAALIESHSILFDCAVELEDWELATTQKMLILRLTQSRPATIALQHWDKVATVDATANQFFGHVEYSAEKGVTLSVDYTPVTEDALPHGAHLLVAATNGRAQARWFELETRSLAIAVDTPTSQARVIRTPSSIDAYRDDWLKRQRVAAAELGAALQQQNAYLAVIGYENGKLELWGRPKNSRFARRLKQPPSPDLGGIAASLQRWEQQMSTTRHSSVPLLRESEADRTDSDARTPWWVYAAVATAVTVGVTIVALDVTGNDTQRFKVVFP